MCNFCNDIKNIEEYREMSSWDKKDTAIVKKLNGVCSLWIECEDCYYNRAVMDITFCPVCGRYLNEE